MTIRAIVAKGSGTAGAWRITRDGDTARLVHYGTVMLTWNVTNPADENTLDWSIGWGSVSDQNGMNTAFKVLNLPYRFSRNARGGGPRIDTLTTHPCGHHTDPRVTYCTCAANLERHLALT